MPGRISISAVVTMILQAIPDEGFPNPNCFENQPLPLPCTPASAESTVTIKACPSFPEPHTYAGPACPLPDPPAGLRLLSADDTRASHFSLSTEYTAGTPLTRSPLRLRAPSRPGQPRPAGPRPSSLSSKSKFISKGIQLLVLALPYLQYCEGSEATRDSLQPDLADAKGDTFHAMPVSPHLDLRDSLTCSGLGDSPRKIRRKMPPSLSFDTALSLLSNMPSTSPFLDTHSPVMPIELEEQTSEHLRIELGFILMSGPMLGFHSSDFANATNKHIESAPDSSKRPPNAANFPAVDSAAPWQASSRPNHIREWAASIVPSVDA